MLLWEIEYKREEKNLKMLTIILIFFLIFFIIYHSFFSLRSFFYVDKSENINKTYTTEEANKIITKFDNDFLSSKKYQDLTERSYQLSLDISSGRQNPFKPYR